MAHSAEQEWALLDGIKGPLLRRIERYAALTIPKICLPPGFNVESTDQTHDYQSIGAQAVNHLTNKIMLALFAPSRPFFRGEAGPKTLADLAKIGIDETKLAPILAKMERDAVKVLDKRGQRPKLYQTVKHLIIAGNVLLCLEPQEMRVMGIRYFCVKRDSRGAMHKLIIREEVKFDELDQDVQDILPGKYQEDTKVCHYKVFKRDSNGDYNLVQWVDSNQLPVAFNGKWPEARFPYRVLTWDLSDESDYGTGLVEEYSGDLEAMSVLSEAVVDGAVLGSEFRWLVNPTGQTTAEDLNNSSNGDAVPGLPADIAPTQGGDPQAISTADAVMQRYEKRIAQGFLMMSGVTRDAERVTAEEVRLTAQELETSFGGTYSALAVGIQLPIAHWLLLETGTQIMGTDIELVIITGLDALSRNGDLDSLRLALQDLAQITSLPPDMQMRIKFEPIAAYVGSGRGIDLIPFLKSDDEYKADMAAMQQQQVNAQSAIAGGKAAADASTQPQGQA